MRKCMRPIRNQSLDAFLGELAEKDPLVLEAVGDVDRSLIRQMLEMSPLARVRSTTASMQYLARFRRVEE